MMAPAPFLEERVRCNFVIPSWNAEAAETRLEYIRLGSGCALIIDVSSTCTLVCTSVCSLCIWVISLRRYVRVKATECAHPARMLL